MTGSRPAESAREGAQSPLAGMDDDFPVLPRRDVILTLAGVMLALFLSALDQTIVATALPSIVLDLGGFDRLTWITTSYLVASTTAVPIAGRLSDMYGRKWFFVIGIVIFLVGSILAGLSQSMVDVQPQVRGPAPRGLRCNEVRRPDIVAPRQPPWRPAARGESSGRLQLQADFHHGLLE